MMGFFIVPVALRPAGATRYRALHRAIPLKKQGMEYLLLLMLMCMIAFKTALQAT
jgi:hypothetical protein